MKRLLLGFVVLTLAGLAVLIDAAPSGATVSPQCSGTGDFVKSGHHYTAADTGTDKIPRVDDVNWAGQITGVPASEQPYSGKIEVNLPAPFGSVAIDSWSGTTDATGNSGTKHYDIPGFVPASVKFSVSGTHTQAGITCTGSVDVEIEGSRFGPFAIGTFLLTVLFGAGLVLSGLQGNYMGA